MSSEMLGRKVKCCDCGFVGYRRTHDVPGHHSDPTEVSAQVRGDILGWLESAVEGEFLVCFRGQEYAVAGVLPVGYHGPISKFQEKVVEPLRCSHYYPYNPGHTPK